MGAPVVAGRLSVLIFISNPSADSNGGPSCGSHGAHKLVHKLFGLLLPHLSSQLPERDLGTARLVDEALNLGS
jgi:hypothetical protein